MLTHKTLVICPSVAVNRDVDLGQDLLSEFVLDLPYSPENAERFSSNELNDSSIPQILLVTYFRSGSTFLGDLLQSTPRTFYSYEPLGFKEDKHLRFSTKSPIEAFDVLSKLFSCSFTELALYVKFWRIQPRRAQIKMNNFLKSSCQRQKQLCYTPSFINEICANASMRLIKVVRLHMRQVKEFIARENNMARIKVYSQSVNSSLIPNGLKVVLLVRDPRGILNSRWDPSIRWWCKGGCGNPSVLCHEMEQDVKEFHQLHSQDPDRFTLIRYEDLALNPEKEAVSLFQRLSVPFSYKSLREFLSSHTSVTQGKEGEKTSPYSTKRNSSITALDWMNKLSAKEVSSIQEVPACARVIQRLGYQMLPFK